MTERQLLATFEAIDRGERQRRAEFIEDVATAVWGGDAAEARARRLSTENAVSEAISSFEEAGTLAAPQIRLLVDAVREQRRENEALRLALEALRSEKTQ